MSKSAQEAGLSELPKLAYQQLLGRVGAKGYSRKAVPSSEDLAG